MVREVRGAGLWRGVALTEPLAGELETAAFDRGLLVNAVRPDVLRLAPPLIVTTDDVDRAVEIVATALSDVASNG